MTSTAYRAEDVPEARLAHGLRPARRRARPRGHRPVRGAGVDGRRVLDASATSPAGSPGSSTRSPPATTRRAAIRSGGPRGARCSRATAWSVPSRAARARPRGAARRRPRLRLRARRPRRHGARDRDLARGRLPGLRVAHGVAPGHRPGRDRPREPALRAGAARWSPSSFGRSSLADAVPRRRVTPSQRGRGVPPGRGGPARGVGRRGRGRRVRDEHGPRRAARPRARAAVARPPPALGPFRRDPDRRDESLVAERTSPGGCAASAAGSGSSILVTPEAAAADPAARAARRATTRRRRCATLAERDPARRRGAGARPGRASSSPRPTSTSRPSSGRCARPVPRFGPMRLGLPTAGDGTTTATFDVDGDDGRAVLAVTVDAGDGRA